MVSAVPLVVLLASVVWALPTPPKEDVPVFADAYTAKGIISLPYAELLEPFDAYFDKNAQKSRIDYYGGEMKTFQIATKTNDLPTGAGYKIVWSPNAKTHVPEETCYQANGTDPAGGVVAVQSILPDLNGFKFVKEEPCYPQLNFTCQRFENETLNFGRKSKYTFWSYKNGSKVFPVRYEMMGYNSLLHSHYDKYVIYYTSYKVGAVNDDVFNVKKIVEKCVPYPSGAGLPVNHLFNPIREFTHHDETHLDSHFEDFTKTHNKQYSHETEEAHKKDNFRHNLRFINSHNRRNLTYALKVNHMADLSKDELKVILGKKAAPGSRSEGKSFPAENFKGPLPRYVDWRLAGAVTPVKDQAICGSCWSFGAVAHIEGMYFQKSGNLTRFAEQQLVDCSWNEGNGACDGGEDFQAYHYIIKYGLATDEQYGPYKGIDGKCHDTDIKDKPITTLKGYVNVTGIDNLKTAIANVGPISVGIDVIEPLVFYSHGIFDNTNCKNTPKDLNHAVLAVGYGDIKGVGYILIKNSWSTYWGNDGYMLMAQRNNMCGVAAAATYVVL